jgi:hypothetical protein
MPDGNGWEPSSSLAPESLPLIWTVLAQALSIDFCTGGPVEPQKRFCKKNRNQKKRPNRKTGFLSNALNGRE